MVYSDAINNQYVGNCLFSNADINNPTTDYFQAEVPANWTSEMTAFFTALGVDYSNLATAITTTGIMYRWTPNGDSTANATTRRFEVGKAATSYSRMYNNAGTQIINLTSSSATTSSFFALCGNNKSIGFFNVLQNANRTLNYYEFWYQGELDSVNTTGGGYYSGDITTRSIVIMSRSTSISTANTNNFAGGVSKSVLTTGKAEYAISCSDAQTPTYNTGWGTDLWVFDNNVNLSYPVIGKARNLLVAVGTQYILGRPTRFGSSQTMPDGGYNCWLPVATHAGKTLFMRCYSSTILSV